MANQMQFRVYRLDYQKVFVCIFRYKKLQDYWIYHGETSVLFKIGKLLYHQMVIFHSKRWIQTFFNHWNMKKVCNLKAQFLIKSGYYMHNPSTIYRTSLRATSRAEGVRSVNWTLTQKSRLDVDIGLPKIKRYKALIAPNWFEDWPTRQNRDR